MYTQNLYAGHSGPICNVCKPGYVATVTGGCETCKSDGTAIADVRVPWEFILFLCCLGLIFILVMRKQAKQLRHMTTTEEKLVYLRRNHKRSIIGLLSTKFKILVSMYQVLSQFENILQVRFPPIFENFSRQLGEIFNFDFLSMVKVGCIVDTNFYTRLLVTTITPIVLSLIILAFSRLKMSCAKSEEIKRQIRNRSIGMFLVITYMVFVSVSMTIFSTFGCRTYGDNQERFLALDQSISCDTYKHKVYKMYALVMILVYPVGITALYSRLLWTHREALVQDDREENKKLHKISFLWDDYEPEMWWFEVSGIG